MFFVGRTDGMVDVWDLTHSSYAPLSSQPVCLPTAVSFLVPGHLLYGSISKGAFSFLAAGTSEGVVHLMELPKGITQPVSNEVRVGKKGLGGGGRGVLFRSFTVSLMIFSSCRCLVFSS